MRTQMPPDVKAQLERSVAENLFKLKQYREAETLLVYISKDIEVGTDLIIEQAMRDSKRIAAPRCDTEAVDIDFYYINSRDDLVAGCYGLFEPDVEKCERVEDFSATLCLVPALAYDREGYRLGFGKGYYDRFLARYDGFSAGLCYDSCVAEQLPRGEFDRAVDVLVTDKHIF